MSTKRDTVAAHMKTASSRAFPSERRRLVSAKKRQILLSVNGTLNNATTRFVTE